MKHGRKHSKQRADSTGDICKNISISVPGKLHEQAMEVVQDDPELDFSKYVRRLIRADLAKAHAA